MALPGNTFIKVKWSYDGVVPIDRVAMCRSGKRTLREKNVGVGFTKGTNIPHYCYSFNVSAPSFIKETPNFNNFLNFAAFYFKNKENTVILT